MKQEKQNSNKRWGAMVHQVFDAVAEGEVSTTDAFIYVCIARHACPNTKMAFPSQSKLMEYTGFSNIKTIKRAILKLKKAGLIEVKRGWKNRYYLPHHTMKKHDAESE